MNTIPIAALPFFSETIFQTISFYRHDLMRAHQIPVLIQVFSCHFPEQIRITDCRKYIVRFHSLIAVICPKLKEFRQVSVPCIEIYRDRSRSYPKLIYRNRSIIHDADPAYHSACRPFKSSYHTSRCTYFPEIQPHSAAVFAYHGKIINRPENSFQTVGNSVNKTRTKLMKRLSCICQSRSRHCHF